MVRGSPVWNHVFFGLYSLTSSHSFPIRNRRFSCSALSTADILGNGAACRARDCFLDNSASSAVNFSKSRRSAAAKRRSRWELLREFPLASVQGIVGRAPQVGQPTSLICLVVSRRAIVVMRFADMQEQSCSLAVVWCALPVDGRTYSNRNRP